MQADAAAAVAGQDRLVLVVGPAGAGKTDDARRRRRRPPPGPRSPGVRARPDRESGPETSKPRPGCAPTRSPSSSTNTTRPDRPPEPATWVPAGTTVIVDEAGMLATGDLHRLIELADQRDWRLALIGDPHQLQAVARGGMFAELCATGRSDRARHDPPLPQPWEADASLSLRHGDPAGLYDLPSTTTGSGPAGSTSTSTPSPPPGSTATGGQQWRSPTTTNEHVDAINTTIQRARIDRRRTRPEPLGRIGDGECACRRRHRHPPQRPTAAHHHRRHRPQPRLLDRHHTPPRRCDLTVTRIDGHGTVTLPAGYVAEHVQLGYAATEPGNQSDTVTAQHHPRHRGHHLPRPVRRRHPRPRREPDPGRHRHPRPRRSPRRPRTHPRHRPRRHPRHHPTPPTRRHRPADTGAPTPRCQIPDWFDTITATPEPASSSPNKPETRTTTRPATRPNRRPQPRRAAPARTTVRTTRRPHRHRPSGRQRTTRRATSSTSRTREHRPARATPRPYTPRRNPHPTHRGRTTPGTPTTGRRATPRRPPRSPRQIERARDAKAPTGF